MTRKGDKRKPVVKPKVNPFDRHFNWMGVISVIMVIWAIIYVLYYLYVVTASGDTPTSSVFTELTTFIGKVMRLFVENTM